MNTILTAALVLGVMSTTPTAVIATTTHTPPTSFVLPGRIETKVDVAPQESVAALISRVATEVGVSSTTLYNLSYNESGLNPDARGDKGCSLGLTQQNVCANTDITKEQALDPEWSLRRAAKDIKSGKEYRYMVCNCWGYIKANFIKSLPNTAALYPNSEPRVGAVAIYDYNGTPHYAYVTTIGDGTYKEIGANLKPCDVGRREVSYSKAELVGFWYPA